MQKDKKQNSGMSDGMRLFLKSAMWTFIAIALAAIGYFGAGYMSGML